MAAPMSDSDLIEREKQFWEAMRDRDADTAARLSDETTLVVGPQGIGEIDRKTLARMIENAPYEVTRFEFDKGDIHVRRVGDEVAIIAYKVREELVVDGRPLALEVYDTSVWVYREGDWTCVLHTETLPGDPFGREVAAAAGTA